MLLLLLQMLLMPCRSVCLRFDYIVAVVSPMIALPELGQSCAPGSAVGVSRESWWEWFIGAAASLAANFFLYFGVDDQGESQGGGLDLGQWGGQDGFGDLGGGQGGGLGSQSGGSQGVGQGGRVESFGDVAAAVSGGDHHGVGVGGFGVCASPPLGEARYDSSTSLKPFFNVFLAVWATVRGKCNTIVTPNGGGGAGGGTR